MNIGKNLDCLEANDELELLTFQPYSNKKPILDHFDEYYEYDLEDFDVLQTIGKGGYSLVYITRCKRSAKIYALKCMDISTIK